MKVYTYSYKVSNGKEARLRMTLMAPHDYNDVEFVLDKINKVKINLCI